jgi:hypothetical protein
MTIIGGLRGDDDALYSRDGDPRDALGEPKSFFEARLIARLRAFEAAREAMLEGEEESGGTLVLMLGVVVVLGGGGNVMLPPVCIGTG